MGPHDISCGGFFLQIELYNIKGQRYGSVYRAIKGEYLLREYLFSCFSDLSLNPLHHLDYWCKFIRGGFSHYRTCCDLVSISNKYLIFSVYFSRDRLHRRDSNNEIHYTIFISMVRSFLLGNLPPEFYAEIRKHLFFCRKEDLTRNRKAIKYTPEIS